MKKIKILSFMVGMFLTANMYGQHALVNDVDITAEVRVRVHIWAIHGSTTIDIYLPHDFTFHKSVKAVVNGRHGDLRFWLFSPHENFLCSRMITLANQYLIYVFALRSEPKSFLGKPFNKEFTGPKKVVRCHKQKMPLYHSLVNTWNNSK